MKNWDWHLPPSWLEELLLEMSQFLSRSAWWGSFSLCCSQITQSIEWLQLASLLLQKYRNLWQAFLTEQKICSPFVTTCQFTYSSFWFSRLHKFTQTKLSWLTNCFSDYFKCWEEIFMSFWPVLLRWSSINWKCLCSFLNSLR